MSRLLLAAWVCVVAYLVFRGVADMHDEETARALGFFAIVGGPLLLGWRAEKRKAALRRGRRTIGHDDTRVF